MASGREKRPNAGQRMEEYLQTLKEDGHLSSPGQMDKKGGTPSQIDSKMSSKHGAAGTSPRSLGLQQDPEPQGFQSNNYALEAKCAELERKILEAKIAKLERQLVTELGASVNPASSSSQNPQGQGTLPKFKKINEYVWKGLNADEGQCIDVGNGVKINIGERKLALREVTVEMWGYASLQILLELIKEQKLDPTGVQSYIKYTQSIFRLAANNVWHSVLLYDREYRELQHRDEFLWNTACPSLREFNLIPKRENATAKALNSMMATSSGGKTELNPNNGFGPGQGKRPERARGPFLPPPDGREICRRFNNDTCRLPNCRMAHNCYICYGTNHPAIRHGVNPNTPKADPKNA